MYLIAKHKVNQSNELHSCTIKMENYLITLYIIYLNIVIIHQRCDSPNEYKN
jgi:hypothetical protein